MIGHHASHRYLAADAVAINIFDFQHDVAVTEQQHVANVQIGGEIGMRNRDGLRRPRFGFKPGIQNKSFTVQQGHFAVTETFDPDLGPAEVADDRNRLPHFFGDPTQLPDALFLLGDGHVMLTVEDIDGHRVGCKVTVGGVVSDHQGLNRQRGGLSAGALTDKDRDDIVFAADKGLDYLAVSFVRDAADVEQARQLLRGVGSGAHLIAKIELAEAVANIDSIVEVSDAIMVARGDLGVEMGYAELTGLQKRLIRLTRGRNRVVVTATQMMESMIHNPVPTRAEVSDVANAVMDGSDALMLSAETAVGEYPVKAVQAMADIIVGAEKHQLPTSSSRHRMNSYFERTDEAIAMAVMYTANHLNVKAIIALTESGATTTWMSRIRSDIPIFAITRHESTRRRVTLYRGVHPVAFDIMRIKPVEVFRKLSEELIGFGAIDDGDLVIYTRGDMSGVSGGTNTMKIMRVGGPDAA